MNNLKNCTNSTLKWNIHVLSSPLSLPPFFWLSLIVCTHTHTQMNGERESMKQQCVTDHGNSKRSNWNIELTFKYRLTHTHTQLSHVMYCLLDTLYNTGTEMNKTKKNMDEMWNATPHTHTSECVAVLSKWHHIESRVTHCCRWLPIWLSALPADTQTQSQ